MPGWQGRNQLWGAVEEVTLTIHPPTLEPHIPAVHLQGAFHRLPCPPVLFLKAEAFKQKGSFPAFSLKIPEKSDP